MVGIIQKVKHVIVPSRELTYPTLGSSENHRLKMPFFGGIWTRSLEGMFSFCGFFFWQYYEVFSASEAIGVSETLATTGPLLRSNHLEIGKVPAI